jgi:hypothetical protein
MLSIVQLQLYIGVNKFYTFALLNVLDSASSDSFTPKLSVLIYRLWAQALPLFIQSQSSLCIIHNSG